MEITQRDANSGKHVVSGCLKQLFEVCIKKISVRPTEQLLSPFKILVDLKMGSKSQAMKQFFNTPQPSGTHENSRF